MDIITTGLEQKLNQSVINVIISIVAGISLLFITKTNTMVPAPSKPTHHSPLLFSIIAHPDIGPHILLDCPFKAFCALSVIDKSYHAESAYIRSALMPTITKTLKANSQKTHWICHTTASNPKNGVSLSLDEFDELYRRIKRQERSSLPPHALQHRESIQQCVIKDLTSVLLAREEFIHHNNNNKLRVLMRNPFNRSNSFFHCTNLGLLPGVQWSLKRKSNPNQRFAGINVLHAACSRGHYEIAELLLKYHADVDALTNTHDTALAIAAEKGDHTMVKLLIDYHANVNLPNKKGNNPLMRAVGNNHTKTVALLLAHGADPKIRDHIEFTALHFAHTQEMRNLLKQMF